MSYHVLPPVYSAPTTGSAIAMAAFDGAIQHLLIDPAGTLATLTVTLPVAADGQTVVISSSQIITSLTLNSAAGSVLGAITAITANILGTSYTWSASASKWFRS